MLDLKIIKDFCKRNDLTLTELADQSGVSYQAIQRMMRTNSTKTDTLQKIADTLNIDISEFFYPVKEMLLNSNGIVLNHFVNDHHIMLLSKRFDKFSDKLGFLLDEYFYLIFNDNNNHQNFSYHLLYPFKHHTKPKYIFRRKNESIFPKLSSTVKELPFSRWPEEIKKEIKNNKYLMESFYFLIFHFNVFNIVDFLNDGFISDEEVIIHWENWKKIEKETSLVLIPVHKNSYTGELEHFSL